MNSQKILMDGYGMEKKLGIYTFQQMKPLKIKEEKKFSRPWLMMNNLMSIF